MDESNLVGFFLGSLFSMFIIICAFSAAAFVFAKWAEAKNPHYIAMTTSIILGLFFSAQYYLGGKIVFMSTSILGATISTLFYFYLHRYSKKKRN